MCIVGSYIFALMHNDSRLLFYLYITLSTNHEMPTFVHCILYTLNLLDIYLSFENSETHSQISFVLML
jgi:hypothetical protein